jgi:hypothetical protein
MAGLPPLKHLVVGLVEEEGERSDLEKRKFE